MDLANDLPLFYADLAETVVSASGTFPAFLDLADQTLYDIAAVSTHTLQYRTDTTLAAGQLLTIADRRYKVVGVPLRINANEFRADLVKQ